MSRNEFNVHKKNAILIFFTKHFIEIEEKWIFIPLLINFHQNLHLKYFPLQMSI